MGTPLLSTLNFIHTWLCEDMAAEAAEAQLTEYLRNEVVKVEKECIRPLQVMCVLLYRSVYKS